MSKILDNIYICVFLVNSDSVLLLALVKYMLRSNFAQNCIFWHFLEAKNPCFMTKNRWKSYVCVFFLSKKGCSWFYKNLHDSEVVSHRKLPEPSLNRILMLYRLVYNMCAHSSELILAWSAYLHIKKHCFINFCYLFLKSSKALSVSLSIYNFYKEMRWFCDISFIVVPSYLQIQN